MRYSPRPIMRGCSAVTWSEVPPAEISRSSSGRTSNTDSTVVFRSVPPLRLQTVSPAASRSIGTGPSGVATSVPSARHPPPPRAQTDAVVNPSSRTAASATRIFIDLPPGSAEDFSGLGNSRPASAAPSEVLHRSGPVPKDGAGVLRSAARAERPATDLGARYVPSRHSWQFPIVRDHPQKTEIVSPQSAAGAERPSAELGPGSASARKS